MQKAHFACISLAYIYNNVYFCSLTNTFYIMAVIRNTASALANGRIGNTTYYVMNGQQVARQAQNNSNYGESASRTDAQQSRRVRWANLVNAYKTMSSWMKKAFESKNRTQSDYNKFMQLNINSSTVALTKDMAANGCAVWEAWTISQGSLLPIGLVAESLNIGVLTDIALSAEISASTTIAALSADIIANNPGFRDGDNIAQIFFVNTLDSRGYPYVETLYYEFTLDTSNTALLSTLPVYGVMDSSVTGGGLHLATKGTGLPAAGIVGYAWVHTRKVNGSLQVSTQDIFMQESTYVNQFSSDNAVAAAIASYGVDAEVPLDPSFLKASGVRVSANGAELIVGFGRIFQVTGAQTVVITGRNMTSENVQLYHDDVLYTPLSVSDDEWTYILGDNGVNKIYVNGNLSVGLEVSGVVVPSVLPNRLFVANRTDYSAIQDSQKYGEIMNVNDANCINAPIRPSESHPYMFFSIFEVGLDESDFSFENVTRHGFREGEARTNLVIELTDATKPAYIAYKGFIIAVFNYTA